MSKFHSLPEDDEVLLLVARFQPPAVVHGLGHHQDPGVYNIYIILYYSHKIFWGPQRTPEWNVSNQLAIQHPSPCGKLRKIKSQKKKWMYCTRVTVAFRALRMFLRSPLPPPSFSPPVSFPSPVLALPGVSRKTLVFLTIFPGDSVEAAAMAAFRCCSSCNGEWFCRVTSKLHSMGTQA